MVCFSLRDQYRRVLEGRERRCCLTKPRRWISTQQARTIYLDRKSIDAQFRGQRLGRMNMLGTRRGSGGGNVWYWSRGGVGGGCGVRSKIQGLLAHARFHGYLLRNKRQRPKSEQSTLMHDYGDGRFPARFRFWLKPHARRHHRRLGLAQIWDQTRGFRFVPRVPNSSKTRIYSTPNGKVWEREHDLRPMSLVEPPVVSPPCSRDSSWARLQSHSRPKFQHRMLRHHDPQVSDFLWVPSYAGISGFIVGAVQSEVQRSFSRSRFLRVDLLLAIWYAYCALPTLLKL